MNDKGKSMDEIDRDMLISRVVDEQASDDDWNQLRKLGENPEKPGAPPAAPERKSSRRAPLPALPETVRDAGELRAEIDAMRVEKVAWRQIDWKICLLEGLKESRRQKKPVILWVFIDRPIDDERC